MDKLTARVTLRMGEELHRLLLDAAKDGSRPLNTEILRRLEMTFSGELNFQLSEKINDLGENDRLSEGQRAEVLELIRKELKNP
jgi:hypothetical protein